MDIGASEGLLLVVFILGVIYFYLTRHFSYFQQMGVGGPKPWPIFGNTLDFLNKKIQQIDLDRAREYGDVYGVYEGATPALVTADLNMIRAITQKDFNHFMDRKSFDLSKVDPALNKTLTNLTGDKWREARNVVSPSFTTGRMKEMFTLMTDCSKEFLTNCRNYADTAQILDMKQTFGGVTMNTIASCGFGIKIDSLNNPEEPFVVKARNVMTIKNTSVLVLFMAIPKVLSRLPMPKSAIDNFKFFIDAAQNMITMRDKSNQRRNDMLQHLLDARKSDDVVVDSEVDPEDGSASKIYSAKKILDDDMIKAQAMQMLLVGYETTAVTLSYISYNLAMNPECQETLINEIDDVLGSREMTYEDLSESRTPYLEMVVAETLRMYPPFPRLDRICTKDYQYENIHVKEGMIVSIPVYVIQHDEKYYPDPDKFIPERFSTENKAARSIYTYMPFGLGPRNCVGMRFALLEVKALLVTVLREFRFVTCPETDIPLKYGIGFTLNSVVKLQLERRSK